MPPGMMALNLLSGLQEGGFSNVEIIEKCRELLDIPGGTPEHRQDVRDIVGMIYRACANALAEQKVTVIQRAVPKPKRIKRLRKAPLQLRK